MGESGLFKLVVILWPKLKPESSSSGNVWAKSCLLVFNLLSHFLCFKMRGEKPFVQSWFPIGVGDTRAQGRGSLGSQKGQRASAVPGNNLSLHISSRFGFYSVIAGTVMREGKEGRWG